MQTIMIDICFFIDYSVNIGGNYQYIPIGSTEEENSSLPPYMENEFRSKITGSGSVPVALFDRADGSI